MHFHGTCPEKGIVYNVYLLPFCFLLNQSMKDNVGETNVTSQLLHLIIIGKVLIFCKKKTYGIDLRL
jgi:hypothetical protein